MKVLITASSRHGATEEIARAIGADLEAAGFETVVRAPDDQIRVGDYDAVILGSAVYMGRWLEPAKRFADRTGAALARRPVWLFSSGPIGDPPKPDGESADVPGLIDQTAARGHRVFAGKLDRSKLGLGERAIIGAFRVADGDDRPWDEIHRWAGEIAERIRTEVRVEVPREPIPA